MCANTSSCALFIRNHHNFIIGIVALYALIVEGLILLAILDIYSTVEVLFDSGLRYTKHSLLKNNRIIRKITKITSIIVNFINCLKSVIIIAVFCDMIIRQNAFITYFIRNQKIIFQRSRRALSAFRALFRFLAKLNRNFKTLFRVLVQKEPILTLITHRQLFPFIVHVVQSIRVNLF